MARYFFHVRNGLGYATDEEGQDLPDVEAARREAIKGARSILSDEVLNGDLDLTGTIEVHNAKGARALTLPFVDAVKLKTGE